MALIKCPECGKEISDQANSCPNCGVPIHNVPTNQSTKGKLGNVFIILAVICWVISFIYDVANSSNELGERAYYLTHGYYNDYGFMLVYKIMTTGLAVIGWILMIIGIVIKFVYRK
jgi:hypothetical protein